MSKCDDILKQGIFQIINFQSYDKVESHYYDWIMQLDESAARKATDMGIDLTIPVGSVAVPLGMNFSKDDWNTWKSSKERLVKQDVDRTHVVNSFSKVPDQGVVAAWSKCMTEFYNASAKQRGLTVEIQPPQGEIVPVTILFALAGEQMTIKVDHLIVTNATLDAGQVLPKTLKSNTPVQLTYSRQDATKPVTVNLQTDRGACFEVLQPKSQPLIIKKRLGNDYGAANITEKLTVVAPFDQRIRVYGGCVAQYQQADNPEAWMVLWKVSPTAATPNPEPFAERRSPKVMMHSPHPTVTMFGKQYKGTQVDEFDRTYDMRTGDRLTFYLTTENRHAAALALVLYVEYKDNATDQQEVDAFFSKVIQGTL